MAGSPEPVPEVNHGWKGAIFALIFALIIVGGASAATAWAVDQNGYDDDYHGEDHGDDHGDDHSDEDHGDDHDDHSDEDHDDHSDEDHSDG